MWDKFHPRATGLAEAVSLSCALLSILPPNNPGLRLCLPIAKNMSLRSTSSGPRGGQKQPTVAKVGTLAATATQQLLAATWTTRLPRCLKRRLPPQVDTHQAAGGGEREREPGEAGTRQGGKEGATARGKQAGSEII